MPIATATIVAIAGLGLSAGSAVAGANASKKAAEESKRAENIRRQQAQFEESRRRRDIIRQAQINRSRIVAASVNSGTAGSSGELGGISSVNARTGEQLGALGVNADLGAQLFDANANIAGFRQDAAIAGAVGDLGKSLMANSQTIGDLSQSLFSDKPAAPTDSWNTRITRTA